MSVYRTIGPLVLYYFQVKERCLEPSDSNVSILNVSKIEPLQAFIYFRTDLKYLGVFLLISFFETN